MSASFFSEDELTEIGFASYGKGVLISRKASIYSPQKMRLGDYVRIDDFSFLNGEIHFGSYIHVSPFCLLVAGKQRIVLEDFSGLSAKVSVYGTSDDYSGASLTNPMVPDIYKTLIHGDVTICRHAIIGASSIILPGVVVGEGCAVGALSLVSRDLEPWGVYTGTPAKRVKERKKDLLELEKRFLEEERITAFRDSEPHLS